MHDATPSLGALLRGLRQMLLGPARNHRRHRGDSQFGGLLDGPLHAIELIDGQTSVTGSAGSASSSAIRLKRTSRGVTAATSA
jgi:hypothetical protein